MGKTGVGVGYIVTDFEWDAGYGVDELGWGAAYRVGELEWLHGKLGVLWSAGYVVCHWEWTTGSNQLNYWPPQ